MADQIITFTDEPPADPLVQPQPEVVPELPQYAPRAPMPDGPFDWRDPFGPHGRWQAMEDAMRANEAAARERQQVPTPVPAQRPDAPLSPALQAVIDQGRAKGQANDVGPSQEAQDADAAERAAVGLGEAAGAPATTQGLPEGAPASVDPATVTFGDQPEPQVTFHDQPEAAPAPQEPIEAPYTGPGFPWLRAARAAMGVINPIGTAVDAAAGAGRDYFQGVTGPLTSAAGTVVGSAIAGAKDAMRLDEPLGNQDYYDIAAKSGFQGDNAGGPGDVAKSLLYFGLYDGSVATDLITRAAMTPIGADAGWVAALAAEFAAPLPEASKDFSSPYAQWVADQYNELLWRTKSGMMYNDLAGMGEYRLLTGRTGEGLGVEAGAHALPKAPNALEAAASDARIAAKERQFQAGDAPATYKQRKSVTADLGGEVPEPGAAPQPQAHVPGEAPPVLAPPLEPSSATADPALPPTPAPTPSATENFAGNQNLNKVRAPEDVKDVIRGIADNLPERGVQTEEALRDAAEMVGITPEKLAKVAAQQKDIPQFILASREMLRAQAYTVWNLSKRAALSGDAQHTLEAMEQALRMITIQEGVTQLTTSAGRALRQYRLATQGFVLSADEAAATPKAPGEPAAPTSLENLGFKPEAPSPSGGKRAPGGVDPMLAMAMTLKGKDPAEIVRVLGSLPDEHAVAATLAHGLLKSPFWDKAMEVWMNWGLLSSPTTHAANVMSNTLTTLLTVPQSFLAAGISKVTGGDITFREAAARTVGMLEGMKEGIPAAIRAIVTENPTGPWSSDANKLDSGKYRATGTGVAGRLVRAPGNLLQGADEFFKALNYRMELNAVSIRQGLKEGLEGEPLGQRVAQLRAAPDDKMIAQASEAAHYQTFTNKLGSFGNAALQLVNAGGPTMRMIVPFVRTPLNVMKYGFDHTPYPILRSLFKGDSDVIRGGKGKAAQADALARVALGGAMGTTAMYLASQGLVTGNGPTNPAERAAWLVNNQPYSMKIGDSWYSYSRLEPLGTIFGLTADMHDFYGAMDDPEKDGMVRLLTASLAKNITSKTWLEGVSTVMQAMNDPDRYGSQYIDRYAGTLVPGIVAGYAREQDPYLRTARNWMDAIKERVPGYRESLTMKSDVWGNPIERDFLGPGFISPIYSKTPMTESSTPTGIGASAPGQPVYTPGPDRPTNEILRLGHQFKGVYPGQLERQIQGVKLSDAEYGLYTAFSGQAVKRGVDMVVGSPGYDRLSDAAKAESLRMAILRGREFGRDQTIYAVTQQGPGFFQRRLQAKAQQLGLPAPATIPVDNTAIGNGP